MFDLFRRRPQAVLSLLCDGILALQRFVDTAVDFCQLLRGKKGAAGNEAGASGKVLFGGNITVNTCAGPILVSLRECGSVIHSIPGDELDAILSGVSRAEHEKSANRMAVHHLIDA